MTVIKADLVKLLRDKTSVSMMECKRALQKTNGDIDAAIDLLRKSGEETAVKKQARLATEGLVVISHNANTNLNELAILEVNCETDFVAKNQTLLGFANQVAATVLATKIVEIDKLSQQKLSDGNTVEQARLMMVSQLGENIVLRRAEICVANNHQVIGHYLHGMPSKIASIVCLEGGDVNLAKGIAMHVAAMRPEYVYKSDIPKDRYIKEEQVFLEQAKLDNSDKSEDIVKLIGAGRVDKFFKGITLFDQIYVKEPDLNLTIEQLLAKHKAKLIKVSRVEVGEGIDKSAS